MVADLIAGKHAHPVNPKASQAAPTATRRLRRLAIPKPKPKNWAIRSKSAASRLWATARRSRLGEPEGMIKTVFDAKTGELLGAHMIGAEVTELIQGYVVGRQLETTEEDLMNTVFPHPTLVRNDARIRAGCLRPCDPYVTVDRAGSWKGQPIQTSPG